MSKSDLGGAAVDPRRHREGVLTQRRHRLRQDDEREEAEKTNFIQAVNEKVYFNEIL